MGERAVGPVALHGAAHQIPMAARQVGKIAVPAQMLEQGPAQRQVIACAGAVAQRAQLEFLAYVEVQHGVVLQDAGHYLAGIRMPRLLQECLPQAGRFLCRIDSDHAP
ncbi:hypothetical protein D3C72_1814790 [compost metagenome]